MKERCTSQNRFDISEHNQNESMYKTLRIIRRTVVFLKEKKKQLLSMSFSVENTVFIIYLFSPFLSCHLLSAALRKHGGRAWPFTVPHD